MTKETSEKSTSSSLPPNQTKLILLLSVALLTIIAAIALIEYEFSFEEPVEATIPAKPVKEKVPEAELNAVVTDCGMISRSVDSTGSISEQYGDSRRLAGYVENTGEVTVKFVRVLAVYRDKNKRIIQTDEIFAVGDTPLHPGERATFEDSKRNYLIQKCGAKVLDWWVVPSENSDT